MTFKEWLEEKGREVTNGYGEFSSELSMIATPESPVHHAVIHRQDRAEGFNWRHSFMLLFADRLVIGHLGYRNKTEQDPRKGVWFEATAIPRHAVKEVTLTTFETHEGGWTEKSRRYTVEFNDGRDSLHLPPDVAERMDSDTTNDYWQLGKLLMNGF